MPFHRWYKWLELKFEFLRQEWVQEKEAVAEYLQESKNEIKKQ